MHAMNRREPYIGMPIYLDDCDEYMGDNSGNHDHNHNHNNNNNNNDSHIGRCTCLENLPLAMAYVPMQVWVRTYEPAEALMNGTLFPELNLPFMGGKR